MMEDIIDKEITVHVRSPSLNETLQVKTTLNATILTLKKAIEPVHPHHPKAASQRIIYSGKLLKDADVLADILKKSDGEVAPTVHLVVKPSLEAATSSSRANTTPTSHPPFPQASTSTASSSSAFSSDRAPQSTGFQMPQNQQQQQPMYPSSLPGGYQVVSINGQYYLAPTLVLSQSLPPQQFHHTQMPLPHAQPPMYPQPADANAFASPHTSPQAQQQQQHVQEPIVQPYLNQLPQQQQQQQNNPLFGGNAPAIARPAIAQRATSIWLALKLIVVLFMLCQGASIERIFLFHAIAFVFFLYQTGRLRFVLRRVRVEDFNRFRPGGGANAGGGLQRPAGAPQENGNAEGASTSVSNNSSSDNLTQRRQEQGEGSGSTSQDNNASGSSDTTTHGTAAQAPVRPLTALDVWKRGAYTFFASLWPTYGVDPQIAQAFQNENNNNNE